ncbi:MAG: hypothetical protein JXA99_17245 [Candidatus Lokiarchaeota archaeon]|nr:hypothetical protein [Candidatus Lokiarchaeota archaeon]
MAKKANKITKQYLLDRIDFKKTTVVKNLSADDIWQMMSIMDEEDKENLFTKTEDTIQPLTET